MERAGRNVLLVVMDTVLPDRVHDYEQHVPTGALHPWLAFRGFRA